MKLNLAVVCRHCRLLELVYTDREKDKNINETNICALDLIVHLVQSALLEIMAKKKKDTGLVPKQKAVVQSYTYLVQFGFSLTVSKGF